MKRIVLLALVASLTLGCAPDGPLGRVGAIVTAPITAPIMFFSARMNDPGGFPGKGQAELPPIDASSWAQAQATLEQALDRGRIDQGISWPNNGDASGYAAGGVTVLATGQTNDGRPCREVLIETAMERRPTDQRVRTYCRNGDGWRSVATIGERGASSP